MALTVTFHDTLNALVLHEIETDNVDLSGDYYEIFVDPPSEYGWSHSGYKFLYWAENSDGTGNRYCYDPEGFTDSIISPVGVNTTKNVYAIWEEVPVYVNKVVLGNRTLLDLTQDTVTPNTLVLGTTAHDASGKAISGTMDTYTKTEINALLDDKADSDDYIVNGTTDAVSFNGNVSVAAEGLLKVITATGSVSLSTSSRGGAVIVDVDAGSGWTPIGIVGYNNSNTGTVLSRIYFMDSNSTARGYAYYNGTSSSGVNVTVTLYVLCIRTV